MGLIADRVASARRGENPNVVTRMKSGWAVMGDGQLLRGYCLLLGDPVVSTLNDLQGDTRQQFLADMATLGDAVLAVTGCLRINYAMYGNLEPELHAHVFPRYADEREDMRTRPVWFYGNELQSRPFDASRDRELMEAIREYLGATPADARGR